MKNITNKLILSSLVLTSSVTLSPALAQDNTAKKNVLFIAVDDLKPLLGCYGDPLARTPNIDKLAQRGTVFTQAYCQQAVSGPSRASLMTGLCPDNTKVWDLKTVLRKVNPSVITIPEHFKANGYTSVGIGKIYDPRSVDKQSDVKSWSLPYIQFEDYFDSEYGKPEMSQYQLKSTKKAIREYRKEAREQGKKGREINAYIQQHVKPSTEMADIRDEGYTDGATAAGAVKFIKEYKEDKPFFFAVGFKKPHLPFCAPKKYWDLYNRADMKLAEFRQKATNSPEFAYHNSGELHSYSDIPPLSSFSDVYNTQLDDDKARELIHGYYAGVSFIDAQIGKLLQTLEEKGLSENTIIVLWGDHGWHLGDHGLWNKHSTFEQATHVPLIIVDPSKKAAKSDAPVELLAIYPSLCEMVGINQPKMLDGTSFAHLVGSNKSADEPTYAVSQYPKINKMGYSIRDKQYRYTVWVDWKNRTTDYDNVLAIELYDYENDPLETHNLVNEKSYSKVATQMESYWQEYIQNRILK